MQINFKKMIEKGSFLLKKNIISIVKKLPIEKAGELFIHILEHENGMNPIAGDMVIDVAFESIRIDLEDNKARYENTVMRNRENGAKGGRPEKPINPLGFKKNETVKSEPKKADIDNDKVLSVDNTEIIKSDNVSQENNISEILEVGKSIGRKKFIPPTLQQITDYIKENDYNVSAYKFLNYYQSNGWKVGKNPMKDWQAAVRSWNSKDVESKAKPDETKISKAFRVAQELGLKTADGKRIGE